MLFQLVRGGGIIFNGLTYAKFISSLHMRQSSHLFLSVTDEKLRRSLIILKSWIFSDRIEQLK